MAHVDIAVKKLYLYNGADRLRSIREKYACIELSEELGMVTKVQFIGAFSLFPLPDSEHNDHTNFTVF